MARTFTADGAPLSFIGKRETAELVKAATTDSRKRAKRTKRLHRKVEALLADVGPVDPIQKAKKGQLLKIANDARADHIRRQRALDELRRRGVTSIV